MDLWIICLTCAASNILLKMHRVLHFMELKIETIFYFFAASTHRWDVLIDHAC